MSPAHFEHKLWGEWGKIRKAWRKSENSLKRGKMRKVLGTFMKCEENLYWQHEVGRCKIDHRCRFCQLSIWSSHQKFTHICFQVLVKEPLPAEAKKSGDSFEDTMLLLDIVRERKKKQNENKKVEITLFLYIIAFYCFFRKRWYGRWQWSRKRRSKWRRILTFIDQKSPTSTL